MTGINMDDTLVGIEEMQPETSGITADDASKDNVSIADMLRQTANEFLREKYLQGFEFNEDYKLYYNPETGYYYDQNTALFYHPLTRCYYYYDSQTDSYAYYTRIPCGHIWRDKLAERKAITMLGETYAAGMSQDEVDVFECLNSLLRNVCRMADSEDLDREELEDEITVLIQEERMEYAACVRMIERTSGTLHVITISGAKIGTSSECDILLPLENCSGIEVVAQITYSEREQKYYLVTNTDKPEVFRNEQKIVTNEPEVMEHGDEWQFGEQRFLAHIHHGTNTCSTCEPGLLKNDQAVPAAEDQSPSVKMSKETLRRRNLRNMKKHYGIYDDEENRHRYKYEKKVRNLSSNIGQKRDNSIYAKCAAKPLPGMTVTSVEPTPSSSKMLDESNRGFSLLQRMGWKQGTGLGRKEEGITEPVITEVRPDRAGLGSEKKEVKFRMSKKQESKQHVLEITRQRFQKAEIFTVDEGHSDTAQKKS